MRSITGLELVSRMQCTLCYPDYDNTARPEPYKYIHFPAIEDLGLEITIGSDGESVALSSKKPIKGIVLDVEGENVGWSDQAIDLVPGDTQVVQAVGLRGREVKIRFLGDRLV